MATVTPRRETQIPVPTHPRSLTAMPAARVGKERERERERERGERALSALSAQQIEREGDRETERERETERDSLQLYLNRDLTLSKAGVWSKSVPLCGKGQGEVT